MTPISEFSIHLIIPKIKIYFTLYVTIGIGTLGYILIVGYSVTPSFWQRLYYYSQSTAPILKTPLY